MFPRFSSHLVADDLALIIKGQIEKKLFENIDGIEKTGENSNENIRKILKRSTAPSEYKENKDEVGTQGRCTTIPNCFLPR